MKEIKSSIMGFAIGDALGVPVEFVSRNDLKKTPVKEMLEYGTHKVPKGTWSDDTSLTLATLDSIGSTGTINFADMMERFVSWYREAKYTATGKVFDYGISTQKAICTYISGASPTKCGGTEYSENGNGSLMRILPFAIYAYNNNLSMDEEVFLLNQASSLTHAHEISCLGCKIYSDYIKSLLSGCDKITAYNNLMCQEYRDYYSSESVDAYSRILTGQLPSLEDDEIKSSGFVVDTLEASIWCVYQGHSYKESVLKAVNLGNDTDTIGAITGSMAGILYGEKSIPDEWLSDLRAKDEISDITNKFSESLNIKDSRKSM